MVQSAAICERNRAPIVAGLFYPDGQTQIEASIASFGLKRGTGGAAAAIIAPHGAWDISGIAAGAAFSAAAGREREGLSRVALMGTLHNPEAEGIFLSDSTVFETPLGDLPVDKRLISDLASCGTLFHINDVPHLEEHGVEVLLPFIKFCFPRCAIVPVLISGSRPALISALARALGVILGPLMAETLVAVSANLSRNASEETARIEAETCVRLLRQNEPGVFSAALREGRIKPCGGAAIAALLESGLVMGKAGEPAPEPLIKSKDENGNTVYYGGIAFY